MPAMTFAKNHFRKEQMEAVLEGSSMKLLSALQSRCCGVRVMKSQNQSALI
jgi:hypothetical protein